MSKTVKLNTPLSEKDVRSLKAGDTVYLNGLIHSLRDKPHIRIVLNREKPPVNLDGAVIYHTAPVMKKVGDKWIPVAVAGTTSMRVEPLEHEVIRKFGIRGIIGKGGMGTKTQEALQKHGCVYFAYVGGCAALYTIPIEEVIGAYWLDTFPESIFLFKVRDFGPLLVAMDSHGVSLYENVREEIRRRKPKLYKMLGIK